MITKLIKRLRKNLPIVVKPPSPIVIKKPSNDSGLSLSLSISPISSSNFDDFDQHSPGIMMTHHDSNLSRRKSLSGEKLAPPNSIKMSSKWTSEINLAEFSESEKSRLSTEKRNSFQSSMEDIKNSMLKMVESGAALAKKISSNFEKVEEKTDLVLKSGNSMTNLTELATVEKEKSSNFMRRNASVQEMTILQNEGHKPRDRKRGFVMPKQTLPIIDQESPAKRHSVASTDPIKVKKKLKILFAVIL